MPDFIDCWAKIQQAKRHCDILREFEASLDESASPTVGLRYDTKTGEYVLYVTRMPDLSDTFREASLIIGDCLHNLRSALDYLIYELARAYTGGTPIHPDKTKFPITDSPGNYEAAIKEHLTEICPFYHAIIEKFQAYKRLDERRSVGVYFHPLQMLRELNDADKHRLLGVTMIPTSGMRNAHSFALYVATSGFMQSAPFIGSLSTGDSLLAPRAVEFGAEIQRAKLARTQPDMDMVGYVTPNIALEDGRSAIAVLEKIGACVIRIAGEFASVPSARPSGDDVAHLSLSTW